MLAILLALMAMACLATGVAFALWQIGGRPDETGGAADDPGVVRGGGDDLPPPSREDEQCVTSMGNAADSGDCFALMYNHCTPGYMSQSGIPAKLQESKKSIIKQIHKVQERNFDKVPSDWTTFCLARPDKAGKGKCTAVKPGEFRVWVKGRLPEGANADPCAKSGSLFIKAHFNADATIQDRLTGRVGHG